MPPFEEYCEALGSKIPCEATKNEFWACGLDMEVLRSLDPRLRVHYMKGKETFSVGSSKSLCLNTESDQRWGTIHGSVQRWDQTRCQTV